LRLPHAGNLVQSARETPVWVIAAEDASRDSAEALQADGVEVLRTGSTGGRLDLGATLKLLAARGITRLMVEGGPTVAAAFVAADLVDDAVLFYAAMVVGADGIDALEGLPLSALTQGRLRRVHTESVGADRLESYERG
jgi:diaminohydroxyphosphoribosylaminopyrimidine deaminase/5-amino-6-(5-phosphoribosylamino)uracil reductase